MTRLLFFYLLTVTMCWGSDPEMIIKTLNPADVPGFVTDMPPEINLHDQAVLEKSAKTVLSNNEYAQMVQEFSHQHPYYALDAQHDPMVLNAKEALKNPEQYLNQEEYQNTKEPDYSIKTCIESKPERKYTCTKILSDPQVYIQPAHYVSQGLSNQWWCGRGNHGDNDPKCGSRRYYPLPNKYVPEKTTISPEHWTSTCDALEAKEKTGRCKLIKKTCLQSGTRQVLTSVTNGTTRAYPVTRECWQYQLDYKCTYLECQSLRQASCEQMESKCLDKEGEQCVSFEQTFRCPKSGILQAGQRFHIAEKPTYIADEPHRLNFEPNNEINAALSQLYILQEVQKDLKLNERSNNSTQSIAHIFKGSCGKCTIAFGGFSDCCKKEGGWGHDLQLAKCDGDEKILAQKRSQELCVEVGSYCSEKHLGVCLRKKKSFCCFPSKLARLLHEQGRKQLGITWGEPENAQCRGLTVDEISRLDFAKLDMSELYTEILSRMKTSTVPVVQRNLQHRIEQMAKSLKNEPPKEGY